MSKYYNNLDDLRKEYFKVLSPVFPEWLLDYIDTPEIQRLSGISMLCGTDYSKIYDYKSFNSTLDHSVGVALIIWNFTKDKKQTLAGLFHDIATPIFKHCIDFMNGDSEHQESTEERTEQVIRNSQTILSLLNRDGIKVEEISDYHIYPIADNNTPRLSADRFEYTFSNGLFLYGAWNVDEISKYYNDITILKNEDGIEELGFKTPQICKEYLHTILPIFANYDSDNNRTVMQFFADIVKSMNVKGYITVDDLYELSEEDVINRILNCDDTYIKESFVKFQNATSVYGSDTPVNNRYCISVKGKKRYIVPLTQNNGNAYRISQIDETARNEVQDYINLKRSKYTGFNFEFNPYSFKIQREDDSWER
ncbi:MAG: hypothetical protein ACI4XD_01275 [Clostridia bacterium]|jgi:hypothetical protein|nr:hypothetical protein [Clostridiales bacterium]